MNPEISDKYAIMDGLSEKKVPFCFFTDFKGENVEVFTNEEIKNKGLLIDFPTFTTVKAQDATVPKFSWEIYPEKIEDYKKGFDLIIKNLRQGNSYLANYTRKTKIYSDLTLEQIFAYSKSKYKFCLPDKFVFFSPETFIEIKNGKISTYPMKGTADASIENAEEILKNNYKEKAEHHTVTDLLRNDLSMVATDVAVEDFAKTELIKTAQKNLFAMSSKISGNLRSEFNGKIGSIIRKLLPAGSILGAPKPKTLEIILQAERYERGWYTGVCGYFDGENLDSCVMIRFIEKENGALYFKSGGGITHLSTLADEYEEMINKIYVPIF